MASNEQAPDEPEAKEMDTCIPHDPQLDRIMEKLSLDNATLKSVAGRMSDMMDRGLSDDPKVVSSLKMLPSYVCAIPDGSETGVHLALDLGGTHFRVLVVKLEPGRYVIQESKKIKVPKDIMTGTGVKLFDHMAECVGSFLREHKLEGQKLPLGFTFSFPARQEGLRVARLINWTKGYSASGVEGQDVALLLQQAMRRRTGGGVNVVAVVNDTVGTLMSSAHEDPLCQIGIILGTGTNACYMETVDRCPKMKEYLRERGFDKMIINMEWGAFGDFGELEDIRTDFDVEVDQGSINPGRQIFEKMISGMYLGEIVRLILVKAAQEKLIFEGAEWTELGTRDRFGGRSVGDIIRATTGSGNDVESFEKIREILKKMGAPDPSPTDCSNVAFVCMSVIKRSAELCAAGIAAILRRLKLPKVTIGIDGAVYRYNLPHFDKFLRDRLTALMEIPCEVQIKLSNDGSGRGAALVAAVAARLGLDSKKSGVAAKLTPTATNVAAQATGGTKKAGGPACSMA